MGNCHEADTDLTSMVMDEKNKKPDHTINIGSDTDEQHYYENPEPIEPMPEHEEWREDDLRRRTRENQS